jgi:hypothetical protein
MVHGVSIGREQTGSILFFHSSQCTSDLAMRRRTLGESAHREERSYVFPGADRSGEKDTGSLRLKESWCDGFGGFL